MSIATGTYNINAGADVEFKSPVSICLEDGFTSFNGSEFLAHIELYNGDCSVWNTPVSNKLITEDEMRHLDNKPIGTNDNELIEHTFFPNPYNQDLYIKYEVKTEAENVIIQLFDFNGSMVYEQSFDGHLGTNMHRIDFDANDKMLLAKVCIGNNCETTKLIRQ